MSETDYLEFIEKELEFFRLHFRETKEHFDWVQARLSELELEYIKMVRESIPVR